MVGGALVSGVFIEGGDLGLDGAFVAVELDPFSTTGRDSFVFVLDFGQGKNCMSLYIQSAIGAKT